MKGKADRIDTDGTHSVVIDYKSGEADFIGNDLLAGSGAQLLSYLRAVELQKSMPPAAAYYLKIHRITKITGGIFSKEFNKKLFTIHPTNSGVTEKPFADIFDDVFEVWEKAAQELLSGDFTARPRRPKKDCDGCQFYGQCGYDFRAQVTE